MRSRRAAVRTGARRRRCDARDVPVLGLSTLPWFRCFTGAVVAPPHLERTLAQFGDFRIATESARAGIPVAMRVPGAPPSPRR